MTLLPGSGDRPNNLPPKRRRNFWLRVLLILGVGMTGGLAIFWILVQQFFASRFLSSRVENILENLIHSSFCKGCF